MLRPPAAFAALLLIVALLSGCAPGSGPTTTSRAGKPTGVVEQQALRERGLRSADLSAHLNDAPAEPGSAPLQREALLQARRQYRDQGDRAGLARLNAVLAAEAFQRAARLTVHWLDQRDPASGLFPSRLEAGGRFWTYGDAGADLFPFLALSTRLLVPERYPEVLATLAAERARSPSFPEDFWLDDGQPLQDDDDPVDQAEKRMLGAVEYARDGLLPLVEALGPDPWLGRLQEVTDQVLASAATPTPRGPIPAASTEINGSTLEVLARLYFATGEPRYYEMGERIAWAYLDRAMPETRHTPAHRWDFTENQPIGPRRFFLGDHGNEIVAGLIEWHRVELASGSPAAASHHDAVRRMLDRLLALGRAPSGLWYELVDVPNGRVRDQDLTDNWGYLAQAYLNQADLERLTWRQDSRAHVERYRQTAIQALRAAATIDYYAWDRGEMDGYADTLESALYLLRYVDVPEAAAWVDQQIAVLYGFQSDAGLVTEQNIDGNFIRTTLLYGLYLTQGARLEPWTDGVSLGAVRDGTCLQIHLHAEAPWTGRLVLDGERHRANLKLPADYPRINQWPEWFSARSGRSYLLTGRDGRRSRHTAADLTAGVPLQLEPGQAQALRLCPI